MAYEISELYLINVFSFAHLFVFENILFNSFGLFTSSSLIPYLKVIILLFIKQSVELLPESERVSPYF